MLGLKNKGYVNCPIHSLTQISTVF